MKEEKSDSHIYNVMDLKLEFAGDLAFFIRIST